MKASGIFKALEAAQLPTHALEPSATPQNLTLLQSEKRKLYTILAFLSAKGLDITLAPKIKDKCKGFS